MTSAISLNELIIMTSLMTHSSSEALQCRNSFGYHDVHYFSLSSCAFCYNYLFSIDPTKPLHAVGDHLTNSTNNHNENYLQREDVDHISTLKNTEDYFLPADVHNITIRDAVCEALSGRECNDWMNCCLAAEVCCTRQLEVEKELKNDFTSQQLLERCPQTWDGFLCWDYTKAGSSVTGWCPDYVPYSSNSESVKKSCTQNGTWNVDDSGEEWTDYADCVDMQKFVSTTIVSISCNVISLALLLPSVAIFILYRSLRNQHRVRVHLNLFLSFIFYSVVHILWDAIVTLDRLKDHSSANSVIHQNQGGCKLLYILTRYSRSTNFAWMFCEAYYLHRLIANAFETPKRLLLFYLLGWGFPVLPISIYSILRLLYADSSCWIYPNGGWEWLIHTPNIIALILNVLILNNILRILITQLQSHPNEPNNYRRALKATFVLVPLFGLQLFLLIYRPPHDSIFSSHYEIISAIVVNLQGFGVALIFCLVNGEVLSHIGQSCRRCIPDCVSVITGPSTEQYAARTFTTRSECPSAALTAATNKERNSYVPLQERQPFISSHVTKATERGMGPGGGEEGGRARGGVGTGEAGDRLVLRVETVMSSQGTATVGIKKQDYFPLKTFESEGDMRDVDVNDSAVIETKFGTHNNHVTSVL